MRTVVRILVLALVVGCGGVPSTDGASSAAADEQTRTAGNERESAWLAAVPEGGMLSYEVTLANGTTRRVQMQAQRLARRGGSIAVFLAPIGTPLDDEPVYPRWIVGDAEALVGLEETAALTTEPDFTPIDEAGRMRTEAAENVAWRVPRAWVLPGRVLPGEEVSVGWSFAERVEELSSALGARHCARLVREEVGGRAMLLVCANLGVIESVRTSADGTVEQRWSLAAVEQPRAAGDHDAEMR